MRRRLPPLILVTALAALSLVHSGCAPSTVMPYTAEVDDPDYRRGKDLLRMGREQEALATFLKVIDQRGGAAPESHLDAAILYQQHVKDPIAAIYHFRRYRELRPNTDQARLALQRIEACIRDFARTLPGQPMDNQVDRTDLMDAVDRLNRENLQLKEQLSASRAALLDASRLAQGGGAHSGAGNDAQFGAPPPLEPSQGAFALETPGALPPRGAPQPEYAAPVGVVPVAPVNPVPPQAPVQAPATAPTAPQTPPAGQRRHVVAKGDTLMSLSLRYYGNRSRWRDILAANRDQLPTETSLQIGMELRIPQ
jgi:tetratricopeptide (TPR) repeat protein